MTEIKKKAKSQKHIDKIISNKITMFDKEKIFFTSDLHLFHENIIKYCNRPWKNANEMTSGIIEKWNSVVPIDADIYNMGDLTFLGNDKASRLHSVLNKLNGRIHLIYGNHDRISHNNYIDLGIHSIHYPYLILPNGYICLHDPALATACPKDSIILSGHVHNLYGKATLSANSQVIIDVGIDSWDYKPVSIQQIENIIKEIRNGSYNN